MKVCVCTHTQTDIHIWSSCGSVYISYFDVNQCSRWQHFLRHRTLERHSTYMYVGTYILKFTHIHVHVFEWLTLTGWLSERPSCIHSPAFLNPSIMIEFVVVPRSKTPSTSRSRNDMCVAGAPQRPYITHVNQLCEWNKMHTHMPSRCTHICPQDAHIYALKMHTYMPSRCTHICPLHGGCA